MPVPWRKLQIVGGPGPGGRSGVSEKTALSDASQAGMGNGGDGADQYIGPAEQKLNYTDGQHHLVINYMHL